ncbi:MAG: RNA polymerase sigma factor region1.1 domain-containing protein, partial [Vicinamibacteria bacterium]
MGEVKAQLLPVGKEKGYLTYEEINNALPSDIVSPDQIDDVMTMFGEEDIEVVDSAQKVKVPNAPLEDDAADTETESEPEDDTLGKTSDPVRVYLREMGQVSLLTRDGEVEIAKRIESAQQDSLRSVLSSPVSVNEILSL